MFPFSINKRRLFSCSGSNLSISNCSSTALNAFFHSSSFTLFALINAIFNNNLNITTGRHWNEFLSNQNSCLNRSSVQPIKNRFTFLVTVTFGRTRYLTKGAKQKFACITIILFVNFMYRPLTMSAAGASERPLTMSAVGASESRRANGLFSNSPLRGSPCLPNHGHGQR